MLILIALCGIALWPLLEYVLHRFLGHEWTLRTQFRIEHQKHHAVKDFFAPAIYKATLTIMVVGGLTLVGGLLVGTLQTFVFVSSFMVMYLFYEWTHYSFHVYPPKTRWGTSMRKHHFSHHFHNAKYNFGVTSSVFDTVFKTRRDSTRVRVPKLFAMRWLFDRDGKLKSEFVKDYEVSS